MYVQGSIHVFISQEEERKKIRLKIHYFIFLGFGKHIRRKPKLDQ